MLRSINLDTTTSSLQAHTPSGCSPSMSSQDYYCPRHPILKEYQSPRLLLFWIPYLQRISVPKTTLILDTLSSKSIGPRNYYLKYNSSRSTGLRYLSYPPFSLPMLSLGLRLLVLAIVHDTWRIQCPLSLPLNQGGNSNPLSNSVEKPKD